MVQSQINVYLTKLSTLKPHLNSFFLEKDRWGASKIKNTMQLLNIKNDNKIVESNSAKTIGIIIHANKNLH